MIARYSEKRNKFQSLDEHLCNVSNFATLNSESFSFLNLCKLAGLLHDLGKSTPEWQQYLLNSVQGKKQLKKDHATVGAQYINNKISEKKNIAETAIQAAVMYHHGSGLPDMLRIDGTSEFLDRLEKKDTDIDNLLVTDEIQESINNCIHNNDLLLDGNQAFFNICKNRTTNCKQIMFNMGLHLRNFSSCLIDADRTDSVAFDNNEKINLKEYGKIPDWGKLLQKLESKLVTFKNDEKLDEIRKNLSDSCFEYGNKEKGIYTCSAFTGAGKTLSSLRFALKQAEKYHMKHIFIIAPYTSILDQNADVIRNILEDEDTKGTIVLECHSNVSLEKKENVYESEEKFDIVSETWNVPVIITTMVQFLETMFGSGTRAIRRMHQFQNCVFVFDEIQTLPLKATYLFNWGLEYLINCCNCSALLCTATQPCLDKIGEEKYHLHITDEIITDLQKHFNSLKRIDFIDKTVGGTAKSTISEVAEYIKNEMQEITSFLAVVNTKPEAKELFEKVKKFNIADEYYHLSTDMCPAHRKQIINQIKDGLKNNKKIICISTRLIEAGVDLSFQGALRFTAGLDSIIQTAGRCNRNNELKDKNGNSVCGKVAIFMLEDEKLGSLEELKIGQKCIERVIRRFSNGKEEIELINPEIIESYFKYYYLEFSEDLLKYNISGTETTILDLLSDNTISYNKYRQKYTEGWPYPYRQAFKTAWENFEVIADFTTGVIVPYCEGKVLIGELSSFEKNKEYHKNLKDIFLKLQQYTVNVYTNKIHKMEQEGMIYEVFPSSGIYALHEEFYDKDIGLSKNTNNDNISILSF